jgi:membrane-bound lytic murein transglycosylase F
MRRAILVLLALTLSTCSRSPGSLEEVLDTGQLRVITRNSPTTFYRGPFGYTGPEYDLAQKFSDYLEKKYNRSITVEFQQADRIPDLFNAVEARNAHIAAASLTITDERRRRVAFGPSYQDVSQHLIYRLNSGRPRSLDDLRGKRLEVLSGSSFAETLADKRKDFPTLIWSENPHAETGDLLLAVQEQRLDYTVVDSIDYNVHRYYMPDLRKAIELKSGDKLAWAFNQGSNDLRAEAELFFAEISANGILERIQERYYGHTTYFDYVGTRTFRRHFDTRLPKYQDLFLQAARDTQIDWRLLAALGYQESHWNPNAVSPTGVRGLMMLTRTTAGGLGVENRSDAAESISAGSQYFLHIYNRLYDVPHPDRIWFALAAYNVGYGHLQDARRLARMQGRNPDRWMDIRDMLPLLTKSEWHSQVPHGYARGWEPVRYVNNVRTYYEILGWLTLDEDKNWQLAPQPLLIEEAEMQTASNDVATSAT